MREYLNVNQQKGKLMHFSRWTRKSYAIFSSLGKTIKISGIALAVACVLPANVDAQQTDTTKTATDQEVDLDEVLVEAQKTAKVYAEQSRVVTQISKDEIERANVNSIQDVLNYVAGIDLRQRGPGDIQADINIRGGTFDQTLILLNGIPINDPQTGHHNLNLPIEINQIESIEVLSGPAAKVYGPNAFSGAINFITTNSNKKNSVDLDLNYGQYNLLNTGISISNKKNKISNFLSANYSSSDGYIDNTDFKKQNIFYQGSYRNKNISINWQSGFTNRAFGANSFYTPKYPNQFEQTRNLLNSISFNHLFKSSIVKIVAYNRMNTDRFELFREGTEIPNWYLTHNYHKTRTSGINTSYSFFSKLGKTKIGIDFRNELIQSNVLGESNNDSIPALFDDGFYTKIAERNNISFFANHRIEWNKLFIDFGLLLNKNSFNDGAVDILLTDLSYKLNKNITAFASVNSAMRNPTFTDLYYQGPTNIGNVDLLAETAVLYEAGLKYRSNKFSSHFSVYYNDAKNVIDWVRKADSIKWQPMNRTNLQNKGVDFGFTYKPENFINSIILSYLYNDANKAEDEYISYYVMDYLKHKINVNLNHRIYKNFSAAYAVNFQDRNGTYTKYNTNNNNSYQKEYQPFTLIDLSFTYSNKNIKFYVKASNIFNTKYVDIANVSQPGRWINAGFKYKFLY